MRLERNNPVNTLFLSINGAEHIQYIHTLMCFVLCVCDQNCYYMLRCVLFNFLFVCAFDPFV